MVKTLARAMFGMAVGVVAGAGFAAPQVSVDPALPTYQIAQGVAGEVKFVGSDSMLNLVTHWAEDFTKLYPSVGKSVEGKGSSTAPTALIEGTATFGQMSRPMKNDEVDKFEKKFGYKPTGLRVAIDCLAIFVNKDAPVEEISIEQARAIFSVEGKDMTWGDLGVTSADWATKPIALYGRNSASGTYGYFKEHVLGKKDFKPTVKEQPGSSGVINAIATDKFAMGYSAIGYRTADVKAVKVRKTAKDEAFAPTTEHAYSGDYPIARFLMVYVNKKPGQALAPVQAEMVKMMFSKQGQEAVIKDKLIPVPAEIAREDLKALDIKPTF
jgi:phosphate transport system substrate-binding protein